MNPIQKALWYVESHSRLGISLEQVASASGVSAPHLTRAFATEFGQPLMRYVRRRRLTEAARQLAAGADDILTVALDHGYGSHEAFTRAFRDEFGLTPERLRSRGTLEALVLTEPIIMSDKPHAKLSAPRVETVPARRLVGISVHYECNAVAGIPDQWQRFSQSCHEIENVVGTDAYGACFNGDESGGFDYMTAVEVGPQQAAPQGMTHLDLPTQKYAVFSHGGHISEIRAVFAAIWSEGLTAAGFEFSNGATLERYSEAFDPRTGLGGFEIWIAVA